MSVSTTAPRATLPPRVPPTENPLSSDSRIFKIFEALSWRSSGRIPSNTGSFRPIIRTNSQVNTVYPLIVVASVVTALYYCFCESSFFSFQTGLVFIGTMGLMAYTQNSVRASASIKEETHLFLPLSPTLWNIEDIRYLCMYNKIQLDDPARLEDFIKYEVAVLPDLLKDLFPSHKLKKLDGTCQEITKTFLILLQRNPKEDLNEVLYEAICAYFKTHIDPHKFCEALFKPILSKYIDRLVENIANNLSQKSDLEAHLQALNAEQLPHDCVTLDQEDLKAQILEKETYSLFLLCIWESFGDDCHNSMLKSKVLFARKPAEEQYAILEKVIHKLPLKLSITIDKTS